MASVCRRLANKASLCSSIRSAFRASSANNKPSSFSVSSPLSRQLSQSRFQGQLGCAQSLLPLHSAVAAARMTSCLTSSSRACRALSQELGLSIPR